jgi:hypothetical protein
MTNIKIRTFPFKTENWGKIIVLIIQKKFLGVILLQKHPETSIYHSIILFPGSIAQFLWSLSESYLNYGNKTLINRSSSYHVTASVGQNF